MIMKGFENSEEERLNTIARFREVANEDEPNQFDGLTKLAANLLNVPISLITLVANEYQFYKSAHGLEVTRTDIKHSFCSHFLQSEDEFFIVEDTHGDERFQHNPFVLNPPYVRFYAGYPLITREGHRIGSLCILDDKPRQISNDHLQYLKLLAQQTMGLLEAQKEIDELKKALDRKDIFVKETHHRIKNNLQIISSLLSVQSYFIEDEKAKGLFRYCQYRINSQSLIHELLYTSENLEKIDFKNYLDQLVPAIIKNMRGSASNIKFTNIVSNIHLSLDTAIPLGLIINEIVTNSLKYAFDKGKQGHIEVDIEHLNHKRYVMRISDDGDGFANEKDFRNPKTLGLQLIHSLSLQLNGSIEKDNSKSGTHYILTFIDINRDLKVGR